MWSPTTYDAAAVRVACGKKHLPDYMMWSPTTYDAAAGSSCSATASEPVPLFTRPACMHAFGRMLCRSFRYRSVRSLLLTFGSHWPESTGGNKYAGQVSQAQLMGLLLPPVSCKRCRGSCWLLQWHCTRQPQCVLSYLVCCLYLYSLPMHAWNAPCRLCYKARRFSKRSSRYYQSTVTRTCMEDRCCELLISGARSVDACRCRGASSWCTAAA
jgi:hypothetical protein